jgi:hypothetical protein
MPQSRRLPTAILPLLLGLMVPVTIVVAQPRDGQGVVVIDPRACQILDRHVPDADVTYRPGVDAQGRAVAPADLPGSAGAMAADFPITFDITADIAQRIGLPAGSGLGVGNVAAARVEVVGDRVLLNGRDVGGPARGEIQVLCSQRRR